MFEKIRKKWQKKIERNSIKSELTHANKKGIKLMKKNPSLREINLPNDCKVTEEVVFKRSLMPLGDWQRINPPVNEDGTLNIMNFLFGGWRNFVKLLFFLALIALVIMQFYSDITAIQSYKEIADKCVPIVYDGLI